MKTLAMTATLVNTLLALAMTSAGHAETADTVVINGKLYTVNEKQPWAEAMAVRDGEIVYVG